MNAFTPILPEISGATARCLEDFDRQHYDRGDGYDARDPAAPSVFCCDGCDAYRETERAYCRDCGEVTGSYFTNLYVAPIGVRPRTLNQRLLSLLLADRALTDAEQAEVSAFEAASEDLRFHDHQVTA